MQLNNAIVSVHDVMPNTLGRVRDIVDWLERCNVSPVTLLVVPGLNWSEPELRSLHEFRKRGCVLVGHGWTHKCIPPRSLYHKLHSLLASRDVAEHLALDTNGIQELVTRCFKWFGSVGLPEPALYVPPAWAMGRLSFEDMNQLPFQYYETLTGLYDSNARRFRRVPLIGFEADTVFRVLCLRILNALNIRYSRKTKLPLRVSIHPFDFDYGLRSELEVYFRSKNRYLSYDECLHSMASTV